MTGEAMESYGSAEAEPRDEQSDLKWAVEWLVKEKGQRRAAKALGVNRKTVALALRRERLTSRMNLAVQRYLYGTRGSEGRQEMPLDRIESQVGGLVESVDEIYRLVDRLALRVEALEEAQPQPKEPEAESEERLWELEIALVGEHGLTMPPGTDPWDSLRRRTQVRWRTQTLERVRRERVLAQIRRWMRRILTLGVWRS